jgi:hypothetical protein
MPVLVKFVVVSLVPRAASRSVSILYSTAVLVPRLRSFLVANLLFTRLYSWSLYSVPRVCGVNRTDIKDEVPVPYSLLKNDMFS